MTGILASTPARIVVGRSGVRYRTNTMLRFRADHAAAKDAVLSEVDAALLRRLDLFEIASRAPDKAIFLQPPDLARALSPEAPPDPRNPTANPPRPPSTHAAPL